MAILVRFLCPWRAGIGKNANSDSCGRESCKHSSTRKESYRYKCTAIPWRQQWVSFCSPAFMYIISSLLLETYFLIFFAQIEGIQLQGEITYKATVTRFQPAPRRSPIACSVRRLRRITRIISRCGQVQSWFRTVQSFMCLGFCCTGTRFYAPDTVSFGPCPAHWNTHVFLALFLFIETCMLRDVVLLRGLVPAMRTYNAHKNLPNENLKTYQPSRCIVLASAVSFGSMATQHSFTTFYFHLFLTQTKGNP